MDFIFLHGGCHDGWCWHLVCEVLEENGHRTWAPDLPCDEPDASASDYADVALARARDADENCVVVAHSLGGLVLPLVAAARPAARMVFVCACVPQAGRSYVEQRQERHAGGAESGDPPSVPHEFDERGRLYTSPERAGQLLYPDVDPLLAAEATRHLRPNGMRLLTETTPLRDWPEVPAEFVAARDDVIVTPAYVERRAHEHGTTPVVIDGAHSPFLSRPRELAELVLQVARADP